MADDEKEMGGTIEVEWQVQKGHWLRLVGIMSSCLLGSLRSHAASPMAFSSGYQTIPPQNQRG